MVVLKLTDCETLQKGILLEIVNRVEVLYLHTEKDTSFE